MTKGATSQILAHGGNRTWPTAMKNLQDMIGYPLSK
jgi:hypothetical protein